MRDDQEQGYGGDHRPSVARMQRRQSLQGGSNAYRPVLAQDVRCVSFKWARCCSAYAVRASSVLHKGGGRASHRPVIGELPIPPQTGKYYFEIRINSDNCRVGFCTENAFPTEESLENCEFGKLLPPKGPAGTRGNSTDMQQTSFLESVGAAAGAGDQIVTAAFHGQTSKVIVNGEEKKHLWRTCIPASGGLFSFVVDTDEGVVQMFLNKLYAGLVFDARCGLKGKKLYPCCSIGGLEESNRSLPKGCFGALVSPPHKFDCLY